MRRREPEKPSQKFFKAYSEVGKICSGYYVGMFIKNKIADAIDHVFSDESLQQPSAAGEILIQDRPQVISREEQQRRDFIDSVLSDYRYVGYSREELQQIIADYDLAVQLSGQLNNQQEP